LNASISTGTRTSAGRGCNEDARGNLDAVHAKTQRFYFSGSSPAETGQGAAHDYPV